MVPRVVYTQEEATRAYIEIMRDELDPRAVTFAPRPEVVAEVPAPVAAVPTQGALPLTQPPEPRPAAAPQPRTAEVVPLNPRLAVWQRLAEPR